MGTTTEWPRFYREEELEGLVSGLVVLADIAADTDLFYYPYREEIRGHAALREHLSAHSEVKVWFLRRDTPTLSWISLSYGDLLFILFQLPYEDLPLHLSHPCPVMSYIIRWRLRIGM